LNWLDFSTCRVLQAKVQLRLTPSITAEWDRLAAEYIRKTWRLFCRRR
jgi:hypothetical protein